MELFTVWVFVCCIASTEQNEFTIRFVHYLSAQIPGKCLELPING